MTESGHRSSRTLNRRPGRQDALVFRSATLRHASAALASLALAAPLAQAGANCISFENNSGYYDWGAFPSNLDNAIPMRGFFNPVTQRVRVYGRVTPPGGSARLHCWEWDGLVWQQMPLPWHLNNNYSPSRPTSTPTPAMRSLLPGKGPGPTNGQRDRPRLGERHDLAG